MEKKLFLLDAYALIYRAYYAFINNPRINSKGMNTSAIFGFTNTLDEVLRKQNPTHIAVVFDPPGLTFRNKMFAEYKANRPPTPEDIKLAIPYIKQIIEAFRVKIYEVPDFEADDVIGSLAKKAKKQGFTTYMMTPDKDYCQLVEEGIYMYKPRSKGGQIDIWGIQQVNEKFDIDTPEKVIDILALWGDSSDNVPGAPGIGEVTSKKLIKQFGNLDGIYENIDKLKGKQKENLIQFKDQVMTSRKLVTIVTDIPLELNENEVERKEPDKEKLQTVFQELEFNTLAKRILGVKEKQEAVQGDLFAAANTQSPFTESQQSLFEEPASVFNNIQNSEHAYILVNNSFQIKQLIKKLEASPSFCFDTETTSINALEAELVGISFSIKEKEAFYLPVSEKPEENKELLDALKPVFENANITKIGQNLKYDIQVLANYNIGVKGKLMDTMIAHYLLSPEQRHNMDSLAKAYLNYEPVSIEKLIGEKGKNQSSMRHVPINKIKDYACEDADITLRLANILFPLLEEKKLSKLAFEFEMPLIPVLALMERNGIKLENEQLNSLSADLEKEIKIIEKEVFELSGENFNLASPKQLGEVLFERMKIISDAKKTKTKQYSTSEKELIKLKDKHPVIEKILEFRSISKLKNTYSDSLPLLVNSKTGKIHTSFNQASVATGRLSSTNPNLQNIPIRTEKGKEIRKAFVPSDENHVLMAADYSQIELRVIAHMSNEKNMIEAFTKQADIHTDTAAKIFSVKHEEVSREMRSQAKTANFGIIYGTSAFGLAENLNIKRNKAKELIDSYFSTYPGIKKFMDTQIAFARDKHYVETISGRRRYLKDIESRNHIVRGNAERNAINAPIQGSAADIIKKAMVNIHSKMQEMNLKSKMVLQVHDELVFDVPREELENMKELVRYEMEHAIELSLPLTVDIGVGTTWLEAH